MYNKLYNINIETMIGCEIVNAVKVFDNIVSFSDYKSQKASCGSSSPKKGVSTEVYAFRTQDEINAMYEVLDRKIDAANTPTNSCIALRNRLAFSLGINVGLRAGDLCKLKWSNFLHPDLTFKEDERIQPEKTAKTSKFILLFANDKAREHLMELYKDIPLKSLNEYIFPSRKGGSISAQSLWKIINETALEAGIKQNIGTHSLRKTWGYWQWHKSKDKTKALVMLQDCFRHASPLVTMKYIGITDEEKKEFYNDIGIGYDNNLKKEVIAQ